MPLISVIIPTRNRSALARATIDSVLAQEGFDDFEVIVVDDGSTDDTPAMLASYGDRIRRLHHPNSGLGASRNLGLANARGTYVSLLDDDDLWFPWTLATQARAIGENGDPWLVSTTFVEFHDLKQIDGFRPGEYRARYHEDFFASAGPSYWVVPSGCCFRAETARAAGGFFTMNYGQEENDLWLRNGTQRGFVVVEQPVCVARRVHAMNISGFSNRNLMGTRYIVEQERKGAYPGGRQRERERRDILTSHVRGVSIACAKDRHFAEGWDLYRKTFAWHVRGGRWRYLLGWPLVALGALFKGKR